MGARDHDQIGSNSTPGKARWGIGLADLTPEVREEIQAPADVKGAVVQQVQPGSAADDAGLREGDVIIEVNRHSVQSAADVKQVLGNVAKGQDALVLVWSNGGSTFRVLHSPEGA
jgi:serine protease Do